MFHQQGKPEFCNACPIHEVTYGYVPLQRSKNIRNSKVFPESFTRTLLVGEAAGEQEAIEGLPFVGGAGSWLNTMLRVCGIPRDSVSVINCIGCRPPANTYPSSPQWKEKYYEYFSSIVSEEDRHFKKFGWRNDSKYTWAKNALANYIPASDAKLAVEYCAQHHLWPQLESISPTRVVALGNEALEALTNRSGILTWRGSPLQLKGHENEGLKVIPTLHPAFLMRQAALFDVAIGDIKKSLTVPPEKYNLYQQKSTLNKYVNNQLVSFDFEWDWNGGIKICGLSTKLYECDVFGWQVDGLGEPISLEIWKDVFESVKELVGHNIIGADTKYFEKFKWQVEAMLWDTMLMSHLVMPDYRKGLGFVASVTTNKVFWKGDRFEEEEESEGSGGQVHSQWQTWDKPYAIPREYGGYGGCTNADEAYRLYNARDTEGCLQVYYNLKQQLYKHNLQDVYWNVSVPCAFICRDMSDAGIKIDSSRLSNIREKLDTEIESFETTLPVGLKPIHTEYMKQVDAPKGTYKSITKICKGKGVSKHEPVSLVFSHPSDNLICNVCNSVLPTPKLVLLKKIRVPAIKVTRPWNSPKQVSKYVESKGLNVKISLKTKKPTTDKNARKGWIKSCPEFLVVDKVKKLLTLRNSFAKDELMGKERMYFNLFTHGTAEGRLSSTGRDGGLNIQNQPPVMRNIYIPDASDWAFLSHDFIQGENMLTAWLAKDWARWERLNTPGYDEHSDMASKFFNLPYDSCLKGGANEVYRKPGKVINHGKNYGLGPKKALENIIAEGMTQFSIKDIFELFAIWDKENKQTVIWQKETIGLAQQQGYLVNVFGRKRWLYGRDMSGKALAFLPASTLADITIRCMIAHYPNSTNINIQRALQGLELGVVAEYMPNWRMCIQVHDNIMSQGPQKYWQDQAIRTREIMAQPWPQLGGFKLGVDIEYSDSSWGEVKSVKI